MAKKRLHIELVSFGLYEPFDRKNLPRLIQFTDKITVAPDCEFGYILRIQGGKGAKLTFRIDHPEFREQGKRAPQFTGEEVIHKNNYLFFLGDTFCEPWQNKTGFWELITWIDGVEVARKGFHMTLPTKS